MSDVVSRAVSVAVQALTESLLKTSDRAAMHGAMYAVLRDENLPEHVRTAFAATLRDTDESIGDNLRATAADIASR